MTPTIHFEPLDHSTWIPDGKGDRYPNRWKARYAKTLDSLRKELSALGVHSAVIEVDLPWSKIRADGLPHGASRPTSPRVRFSFDLPDVGSQSFSCGRFKEWQQNLHGISLTIQRLRLIEEYGATRGRQQYRGWAALPETTGGGFKSKKEAAGFLLEAAGAPPATRDAITELMIRGVSIAQWHRAAARMAHPDKPGGSTEQMVKVNAARDLLSR